MRAVDYSFSHPNPAAITAAGYGAVLRYLGGSPSKQLTAAEAVQLHAHGLLIGLVYESTADRAGAGRVAGVLDASRALQAANELGYPASCPLFFAVDFDAAPSQVAAYFAGVRQVLGARAGIYGGYRVVSAGLAPWRWQTKAWSYGHVDPDAHLLQQITMSHPVPGCDEDTIRHPIPLWGPVAKTPAKTPVEKHAEWTVKAPPRRLYHRVPPMLSDSVHGLHHAAAHGFDWVDVNCLLTADGVPVAAHGAPYGLAVQGFLAKGDDRAVAHLSAEQVHQLEAHRGGRTYHVPRIETVFDQAHELGVKIELEAKWDRRFTKPETWEHIVELAHAAWGKPWAHHLNGKVLTDLHTGHHGDHHGGIDYALAVCKAGHAAGVPMMILPRGVWRVRTLNKPYIAYNRGGRV